MSVNATTAAGQLLVVTTVYVGMPYMPLSQACFSLFELALCTTHTCRHCHSTLLLMCALCACCVDPIFHADNAAVG